ncbi:MAG: MerC domain-containing protein [Caulobacter sp.]|nr:MerC domain-containing protein [Caulobacter sp.]
MKTETPPKEQHEKSGRRISLWLVILALSGLALAGSALVPAFGFLSAFFGLSLPLAILLNVALLGVAWDATHRRLPKVLLVLPALFYGGYFIAAGFAWLDFYRWKAEIERRNAAFDVSFDPSRDALYDVDKDTGAGAWLLENYRIRTAFAKWDRFDGRDAQALLGPKEFCDVPIPNRVDIPAYGKDSCVVYFPASPPTAAVRLSADTRLKERGMIRSRLVSLSVARPGQAARTLTTAMVSLPGLIPLPVFGCGPSGGCSGAWLGPARAIGPRAETADVPDAAPARLLVSAWRLSPRGAAPPPNDPSWTEVRARVTTEVEAAEARMELALQEPTYDPEAYPYVLAKLDPAWARKVGCERLRAYAAEKQGASPDC